MVWQDHHQIRRSRNESGRLRVQGRARQIRPRKAALGGDDFAARASPADGRPGGKIALVISHPKTSPEALNAPPACRRRAKTQALGQWMNGSSWQRGEIGRASCRARVWQYV